MALTEIRVYDYVGTKKTIVIPLGDMKTVRMVCRHLYPRYEEEKYTIYIDEEPLSWDSTFEYLEKKYQLTSSKVLTFKFRYCTFQEAMKRLQREDYQLKSLITAGELKAYSKGGQMIFKESDIENLIQDQMEEPTLILTPDKLKKLRDEEDLEALDFEEENSLEQGISFQLGKDDAPEPLLATSDSNIHLPQINLGNNDDTRKISKSREENLPLEDSDSFEELAEVTDLETLQIPVSGSLLQKEEEDDGEMGTFDEEHIELPSPEELQDEPGFSRDDDDGIVSEVEENEREITTERILSKRMANEMEEVSSEWSSMETLNEPDILLSRSGTSSTSKKSEEERQLTLIDSETSEAKTMASALMPPPSPPPPSDSPSAYRSLNPSPQPMRSRDVGAGSAPASTPANAPVAGPPGNKTSAPILKRHTRITYYNQMNPFQHYSLKIDLTAQKLALKNKEDVSQVGGQVQVSKSNPQVEIVPSFPGCLTVPERIFVDLSPQENSVEFWITPLTEGDLSSAHVHFYHEGKRVATIATPTRVVKTTTAKVMLVAGLLAPILSTFFSAFNIELKDNLPLLFRFFSAIVGAEGWISLANFGLLLFLVAIVFGVFLYKTREPRLAPPIEKEV